MIGDGSIAVLKVGYQEAARLRSWHLTSSKDDLGPERFLITARVVSVDSLFIHRAPLVLGLFMGQSWWVWRGVDIVSKEDVKEFRLIELGTVGRPENVFNFS